MWTEHEEAYPKIAKLDQLRTGSGSRDLLLNFVIPSISKERLNMQTSNLVYRLTTKGNIDKFAKLGQMGKRPRSPELLFNFGPPSISTERLKIQSSNLVRRLRTKISIQKLQN